MAEGLVAEGRGAEDLVVEGQGADVRGIDGRVAEDPVDGAYVSFGAHPCVTHYHILSSPQLNPRKS